MWQITEGQLANYVRILVADVLERLCVPFLLLERDGAISYANGLAETALGAGVHIRRSGMTLATTSREVNSSIAAYLTCFGAETAEVDLLISASDGSEPIFASISPYQPPSLTGMAEIPPFAVMFLREAGDDEGFELARERFGLSAAEVAILREVVGGTEVRHIAIRRGVSILTVRKQMAALLQKMGVARQAELALAINQLTRRGRDVAAAAAMARDAQRA